MKIQITNNMYEMKKRTVKIIAVIVCSVICVSFVSSAILLTKWQASDGYVKFDKNKLKDCFSELTILDADGKPFCEAYSGKDYKQVSLSALHDYTYMAFVCVEDKRFFSHKGIDVKRLVGATLANLKSGSFKEGASTISQQLIKNTHLTSGKTLKRKLNEMIIARELERNYSKNEILEMYLNTIYFGRRAYGIESAAEVYFGKSATELTLSESAILAGMIKAPNVYAPDKDTAKCLNRRNVVLELMKKQGVIGQEEFALAKSEDIKASAGTNYRPSPYSERVIKEACRVLNISERQLLSSDYVIETYCDSAAQKQLAEIVERDDVKNIDGTKSNVTTVLCDVSGRVQAYYRRGEECEKRQAGSAFKPIAVYAPALSERIITEASPILDEPTDFNGYKPTNAGKYYGWTTVLNAVQKSLNVPAVKTLNALTCGVAEGYLAKLGYSGKQDLSLALGNVQGGTNALELAKCYTALANAGVATETRFIKKIYNEYGVLYDGEKAKHERVFDDAATCIMTDMLKKTAQNGTAKTLGTLNFDVAAKTGTVGNEHANSDAIVAGYTSDKVFVCWHYGNFPTNVYGGGAPCDVAKQVLSKVYQDYVPQKFEYSSSVVERAIDDRELTKNQRIVPSECGSVYMFDVSNQPIAEPKFTIECSRLDDYAKIALTDQANVGKWVLIKTLNGEEQVLTLDNCYVDKYAPNALYCVKLLDKNGNVAFVSREYAAKDFENCTSVADFWK